jgi:hypothetical protein
VLKIPDRRKFSKVFNILHECGTLPSAHVHPNEHVNTREGTGKHSLNGTV